MTASALWMAPSGDAGQVAAGIEIWSREAHQLYQKSLLMTSESKGGYGPGVSQCTTPYSPNSRVVSARVRRCSNSDESPKVRVESPWLVDSYSPSQAGIPVESTSIR